MNIGGVVGIFFVVVLNRKNCLFFNLFRVFNSFLVSILCNNF